jgi:hypothetical protein
VVAGRFARHDPANRGPILVSCPASLTPAPKWEVGPAGTLSLFELVEEMFDEPTPSLPALFDLPAENDLLASY